MRHETCRTQAALLVLFLPFIRSLLCSPAYNHNFCRSSRIHNYVFFAQKEQLDIDISENKEVANEDTLSSLRKTLRQLRAVRRDVNPKEDPKALILCTRLSNLALHRSRIGPSGIANAGRGLFATDNFQRGELITCYPGDALICDSDPKDKSVQEDLSELKFIWGTHVDHSDRPQDEGVFLGSEARAGYILDVCDDYSILGLPDLDKDPAYAGHFANDGATLYRGEIGIAAYVIQSNDLANARHASVDDCHMATLATRDIVEGEEILVTYGPEYWMELDDRLMYPFPIEDEDSLYPGPKSNYKGFG